MTIYDRIRNVRQSMGMSQEELAKRCGYSSGRSMIAKIESGKVDIPVSKLMLFSSALNVTPCYLLGKEEYQEQSDRLFAYSARLMMIAAKIDSLDDIDRARIEERTDMMLESDKYREL